MAKNLEEFVTPIEQADTSVAFLNAMLARITKTAERRDHDLIVHLPFAPPAELCLLQFPIWRCFARRMGSVQ